MTDLFVDLAAYNGEDFDSSNIDIVGYDRESKTLYVEFQSGCAVYAYEGVEESTYNLLVTSPSVGRFYAQHIQGEYTATKYDDGIIEPREDAPAVSDSDGGVLTQNQVSGIFAGTSTFVSSITVPTSRYSVRWETQDGRIGGNPEYSAIGEADALAQCNAALQAAFGDDVSIKIVSVTHYLG